MKPLDGVRVLDLTRGLAGPFCTMQLADMGAEVIKVEERHKGDDTRAFGPPFKDGVSTYFLSVNRNKRSVALDLKDARGQALARALARKCDVVAENFRPGTADRLGLSYEALSEDHPRLIYCSMSAYGHEGIDAYTRQGGYDAVMQGIAGLQHLTGEDDMPYRTGTAISDLLTGLTACQGILLALLARERSGRGQKVDISMLDATVQVLTYQATAHLIARESPRRMGNRHPSICPYQTFEAQDGHFNLACGNDALFRKLCEILGRGDLLEDPGYRTNGLRVKHRETLCAELARVFREEKVAHWVSLCEEAGIPAGAINDVATVLDHPQLAARGMVATVTHKKAGEIRVLGVPVKLSATPGKVETAPPLLGEHTREVLQAWLGLGTEEIDALARAGVIADAGRETP
jgi:crotonobetainyl-CoA:carnitine CoA-transferase CaiB-like acyl-CoA transferase